MTWNYLVKTYAQIPGQVSVFFRRGGGKGAGYGRVGVGVGGSGV